MEEAKVIRSNSRDKLSHGLDATSVKETSDKSDIQKSRNESSDGPTILTKEKIILKKIDSMSNVVRDTIEKTLSRGEKMENLGTKANDLEKQTNIFQNRSEEVNKATTTMDNKMKIIFWTVIVVLMIIMFLALFETFEPYLRPLLKVNASSGIH